MTYNIKLRRCRGSYYNAIKFIIFGLILLFTIGGLIFPNFSKKYNLTSKTKAINIEWKTFEDSDGSTLYVPTYTYKVDDNIYTCKSRTSQNTKTNEGVVYYDSKNPSNCMTDYDEDVFKVYKISMLISLILILIGIFLAIRTRKIRKGLKVLVNNGILVKNLPFSVFSRKIGNSYFSFVYYLKVKYKFPDGVVRTLKSGIIKHKADIENGGTCDLLYDPNNFDNYFIDFDIKPTGYGNPQIIQYNQDSLNNDFNYINSKF